MTDLSMTAKNWWPLLHRYDGGFEIVHQWPLPSDIRLHGDHILYGDIKTGAKLIKNPGSKMLTEFLALADAEASEIERYAKRWGVLGICNHELVWGHATSNGRDICTPANADPIDRWRYFAGGFKYVLDEGARLRKARRLNPRSTRAEAEIQRFINQVDSAVRLFGCLRPILVIEAGRFEIKLGGQGYITALPAALTTQLLFTLAGASGIATCAECGRLFMPRRKPRKGENSYCPNCGIRAAWRTAQDRRRKKVRTKPTERSL
jgi:predicted RNA-binding Zn-ribbon protein involved in translation (DUF1610 family)